MKIKSLHFRKSYFRGTNPKDTTPDDVAKKLDLYQENDESAISEIVKRLLRTIKISWKE